TRHAAAFSIVSEVALLTLGGSLKRREMLSARLGDILAELYLASAVLKRWSDEGYHESDLALVTYCMRSSLATIEKRLDEVLLNLPSRMAAAALRVMLLPPGLRTPPPS